eukprot:CAMPEP_0202364566 /NCGR_PEP_ID=MMETSP1126-20121109/15927_1 /ASSEMBLY_ACC=CAM_ASM_000457 /TAXON_ID=3047 /ORGANISM="Dunaliella tertiolecta, Strain CCMP1320" /LENGTH=58 /DNA_ID=CAMNT_0048959243 /DNA_START=388 /DNA_END=561 /DNA_ORIENTATION=+
MGGRSHGQHAKNGAGVDLDHFRRRLQQPCAQTHAVHKHVSSGRAHSHTAAAPDLSLAL